MANFSKNFELNINYNKNDNRLIISVPDETDPWVWETEDSMDANELMMYIEEVLVDTGIVKLNKDEIVVGYSED